MVPTPAPTAAPSTRRERWRGISALIRAFDKIAGEPSPANGGPHSWFASRHPLPAAHHNALADKLPVPHDVAETAFADAFDLETRRPKLANVNVAPRVKWEGFPVPHDHPPPVAVRPPAVSKETKASSAAAARQIK